MAWVAFDRAAKTVEQFKMEGPVERWHKLRRAIHDDVCRFGFDPSLGTFVQGYGSKHLDASALLIRGPAGEVDCASDQAPSRRRRFSAAP
jgi:GH15 family glucan-1,4-alpha-glucosidase